MSSFERKVLLPTAEGIAAASNFLKSGKLVAFPTETVYGLGANAYNEDAVKAIFTAKGRPLTDPLIVHVNDVKEARKLVNIGVDENEVFMALGSAFWPGPLTLIAKAVTAIPYAVTASTGFVGVRCPSHPIARKLLADCQLPLAAPSANRFGHVSPTRSDHVIFDLGEKDVCVLDGEWGDDKARNDNDVTCDFGIESTVAKLDCVNKQVIIFRQGAISKFQLEACLQSVNSSWSVVVMTRAVPMKAANENGESHLKKIKVDEQSNLESSSSVSAEEEVAGQQAPGQAITHYAPDVPCHMIAAICTQSTRASAATPSDVGNSDDWCLNMTSMKSIVIVDFNGQFKSQWMELRKSLSEDVDELHQGGMDDWAGYRDLSSSGSYREAARGLFATLRWAESLSGASGVALPVLKLSPPSHAQSGAPADAGRSTTGEEEDIGWGVQDRILRAASGQTSYIRIDLP